MEQLSVDDLKKKYLAMISEDDLSEDLKIVADRCGLDVAVRLADKCAGLAIYIRPARRLDEVKERFVSRHFNGSNRHNIALALDCSSRWVYEIAKKARQEKRNEPGLFDKLELKDT